MAHDESTAERQRDHEGQHERQDADRNRHEQDSTQARPIDGDLGLSNRAGDERRGRSDDGRLEVPAWSTPQRTTENASNTEG